MNSQLIVFLFSSVLVCFFYLSAVLTNIENRPIAKLPRWFYYLAVVAAFASFGYFFSDILGFGKIVFSCLFAIPGLFVCLSKVIVVPDNEIIIIQNNLFTQKVSSGDSQRLFARSGITPLLHGEVTRETWKQETREVKIQVSNMETADDSTPVDVSLIFWISPDFNNVQSFLTTDHNQITWWTKATQTARGVVTSRVSDLIKKTTVNEAISNKAKMSKELVVDKFNSEYIFEEEFKLGFKISGIKFIDIDLTSDVRSANEQIMKSVAYGKAAKKNARGIGCYSG